MYNALDICSMEHQHTIPFITVMKLIKTGSCRIALKIFNQNFLFMQFDSCWGGWFMGCTQMKSLMLFPACCTEWCSSQEVCLNAAWSSCTCLFIKLLQRHNITTFSHQTENLPVLALCGCYFWTYNIHPNVSGGVQSKSLNMIYDLSQTLSLSFLVHSI